MEDTIQIWKRKQVDLLCDKYKEISKAVEEQNPILKEYMDFLEKFYTTHAEEFEDRMIIEDDIRAFARKVYEQKKSLFTPKSLNKTIRQLDDDRSKDQNEIRHHAQNVKTIIQDAKNSGATYREIISLLQTYNILDDTGKLINNESLGDLDLKVSKWDIEYLQQGY